MHPPTTAHAKPATFSEKLVISKLIWIKKYSELTFNNEEESCKLVKKWLAVRYTSSVTKGLLAWLFGCLKTRGFIKIKSACNKSRMKWREFEGSVKRKNGRATGAGPVFGRSGVERESLELKFARAPGESQT
jgi:hypothetical protein